MVASSFRSEPVATILQTITHPFLCEIGLLDFPVVSTTDPSMLECVFQGHERQVTQFSIYDSSARTQTVELGSIWGASGEHLGPSGEHLGGIRRACGAKWVQGGESDENHRVFHGWRPWATIWPQSGEGDMDEVL